MAERSIYDVYQVKLKFRDKLLGGLPKSPKVIKNWLEARTKRTGPEIEGLAQEIAGEISREEATAREERIWTGFKSFENEKGLYLEERQIKALLREAGSVLGYTSIIGFRDTINHGVFVDPDKIHLGKVKPDGVEESIIGRALGPRGPRSFLRKSDYVEKAEIEFKLLVTRSLSPSPRREISITKERLKNMWELAQNIGLGASRSQGYGKFQLLEFKPVKEKGEEPKKRGRARVK